MVLCLEKESLTDKVKKSVHFGLLFICITFTELTPSINFIDTVGIGRFLHCKNSQCRSTFRKQVFIEITSVVGTIMSVIIMFVGVLLH